MPGLVVLLAVDLVTMPVESLTWINLPRNLLWQQAKQKKDKSIPNWKKSLANSLPSVSFYEPDLIISDAKYYAKVFEKLKTNPQYPMNEKNRLEAIFAKGNVASEK
jgi:Endoplasmic reticulum protein ERp29, C-terminal domain